MNKAIERFKSRWAQKFEEIKLQDFDGDQCRRIRLDFRTELLALNTDQPRSGGLSLLESQQMINDLSIALSIALSNYRKNKVSLLDRLLKGIREIQVNLFSFFR